MKTRNLMLVVALLTLSEVALAEPSKQVADECAKWGDIYTLLLNDARHKNIVPWELDSVRGYVQNDPQLNKGLHIAWDAFQNGASAEDIGNVIVQKCLAGKSTR